MIYLWSTLIEHMITWILQVIDIGLPLWVSIDEEEVDYSEDSFKDKSIWKSHDNS